MVPLMQGGFSEKYTIKQEEINDLIRTIGVRVNPFENHFVEYQHRLTYTKTWSTMIKHHTLI